MPLEGAFAEAESTAEASLLDRFSWATMRRPKAKPSTVVHARQARVAFGSRLAEMKGSMHGLA
jgi:hypothetical protein